MLARINNVSVTFGVDTILDKINVNIDKGDRIGLIGANGSGKSTLLKVMTDRLKPTEGSVSYATGVSVGYLTQNLGLNPNGTVYGETLKAFSPVIALGKRIEEIQELISAAETDESRIKLTEQMLSLSEKFASMRGYYYESVVNAALKGLGFDEEAKSRRISTLSGGQQMRVALAKILSASPDLLLLDEPTNYLDMKSMDWLEGYLSSYPGSYIVVSHDRYFLSNSTNRIWEIEDCALTSYKGNYEAYLTQKKANLYAEQRAYKQQSDYIKRQQAIIDRLKSYNREKSVKRAESREKLLSHIDRLDKPKEERISRINFTNSKVISRYALKLNELSVGYDSKALVEGIDLLIKAGEKIGICGDNATGKSTLLKTICGELPPVSGYIEYGAGAVISHFRQQHDDLDKTNSLLSELANYSGEDNLTVRNVLGSLLFSGDDVNKPIEVLSGGELARVAVAKLMLTRANILLLDEPTNHLDIPSKEVFEQALEDYDGTVIVISHDRYLLNRVAQKIIYIDSGKAVVKEGHYEALEDNDEGAAADSKDDNRLTLETDVQNANGEPAAKKEKLSKNQRRRYEERIAALDKIIEELNGKIASDEAAINSPEFYADSLAASEFLESYEQTKAECENAENEWLSLNLALEEDDEA